MTGSFPLERLRGGRGKRKQCYYNNRPPSINTLSPEKISLLLTMNKPDNSFNSKIVRGSDPSALTKIVGDSEAVNQDLSGLHLQPIVSPKVPTRETSHLLMFNRNLPLKVHLWGPRGNTVLPKNGILQRESNSLVF